MIRKYLKYKKARKIMLKLNKLTWWDAKIVEDKYSKKLEIKYDGFSNDTEQIIKDTEQIIKVVKLLREENVRFWFHYDKDLDITVDVCRL